MCFKTRRTSTRDYTLSILMKYELRFLIVLKQWWLQNLHNCVGTAASYKTQLIGFTTGRPSLVSLVFAVCLVFQVSLVSPLSLLSQVCTVYTVPTVSTASLIRGPRIIGVPGVPPIPSGLKMNGQVWVAGRKVYERPIWIRIVGVRRQREKSFPLECFITRK